MIIRDLFTNEDVYDWSDVCDHENVPHRYSLCLVIDAEKMGLDEICVNDISTRPSPGRRTTSNTSSAAPYSSVKSGIPRWVRSIQLNISQLGKRLEGIQQATLKLYSRILKDATPHTNLLMDYMYIISI